MKKIMGIVLGIMLMLVSGIQVHAEEVYAGGCLGPERDIPGEKGTGGCFVPGRIVAIRGILVKEEDSSEPEPVPSGWVSVGIGDIWSGYVPNGGTLYLPEIPGIKGYTFGSGEVEAHAGDEIPVWDSVWVYPVY